MERALKSILWDAAKDFSRWICRFSCALVLRTRFACRRAWLTLNDILKNHKYNCILLECAMETYVGLIDAYFGSFFQLLLLLIYPAQFYFQSFNSEFWQIRKLLSLFWILNCLAIKVFVVFLPFLPCKDI